jgi:hypothetical protein
MKPTKTVIISAEEYNRLLDAEALLIALQSAGVDNWAGYGDAIEMAEEWKREADEIGALQDPLSKLKARE